MQAFPKDSLNNSIGGAGPINARPDHRYLMGQGEDEAFKDFSKQQTLPSSGKIIAGIYDPTQRGTVLHGDQSLGLGTSTFLEGTPAARTAIQRREAERAQDVLDNPLQRKKSLAQRFRSNKRAPREHHQARAFSTDSGPASVGASSGRYRSERDPFDEYDPKRDGDDVITVRRKNPGAGLNPPSPPRGASLERRSTTDGSAAETSSRSDNANTTTTVISSSGIGDDSQPKPAGLLARVKSLKGGRRPAPPPPHPVMKDS